LIRGMGAASTLTGRCARAHASVLLIHRHHRHIRRHHHRQRPRCRLHLLTPIKPHLMTVVLGSIFSCGICCDLRSYIWFWRDASAAASGDAAAATPAAVARPIQMHAPCCDPSGASSTKSHQQRRLCVTSTCGRPTTALRTIRQCCASQPTAVESITWPRS
jgi:hypothetical protein